MRRVTPPCGVLEISNSNQEYLNTQSEGILAQIFQGEMSRGTGASHVLQLKVPCGWVMGVEWRQEKNVTRGGMGHTGLRGLRRIPYSPVYKSHPQFCLDFLVSGHIEITVHMGGVSCTRVDTVAV